MSEAEKNLLQENTQAMDKYEMQKYSLANVFLKKMNKRTITGNMSVGFSKGVLVGGVLALLFAHFNINTTEYTHPGNAVHAKKTDHHTKRMSLYILAVVVLASLAESGVMTIKDCNKNKENANKLAKDTFKNMFDRPLSQYGQPADAPFRSTRAAALIINNMPTPELQQLRHLAITGLVETDEMFIRNSCISEASTLIADYLKCNPALDKMVSQIMNGENVNTYVLSNMQHQR